MNEFSVQFYPDIIGEKLLEFPKVVDWEYVYNLGKLCNFPDIDLVYKVGNNHFRYDSTDVVGILSDLIAEACLINDRIDHKACIGGYPMFFVIMINSEECVFANILDIKQHITKKMKISAVLAEIKEATCRVWWSINNYSSANNTVV